MLSLTEKLSRNFLKNEYSICLKTDPNIKLTISAIYNLFILFPAKLIISYLCRDVPCSLLTKKTKFFFKNLTSQPNLCIFGNLQNLVFKKKIQF